MGKLYAPDWAIPLVLTAAVCAADTAGAEQHGANAAEPDSARDMLGPRRPDEITVCDETADFDEAVRRATAQARFAMAQTLGDLAYVRIIGEQRIEAYSTKKTRYPVMLGHEFPGSIHRVCAVANLPGQLPKALAPLTPREIGNSGLRLALSRVILADGRTPRHFGSQPDGSEVWCSRAGEEDGWGEKAQDGASENLKNRLRGMHIATSTNVALKWARATNELAGFGREEERTKAIFVDIVTSKTGSGVDGTFSCAAARLSSASDKP